MPSKCEFVPKQYANKCLFWGQLPHFQGKMASRIWIKDDYFYSYQLLIDIVLDNLYGNMGVVGFTRHPIKDALWKATRTTTINTFNDTIRELRALDVHAF